MPTAGADRLLGGMAARRAGVPLWKHLGASLGASALRRSAALEATTSLTQGVRRWEG